jgi:hypothetical protein
MVVSGSTTATSSGCRVSVLEFSYGGRELDVSVDESNLSLHERFELTRTTAGAYSIGDGIHYFVADLDTADGRFGATGADYALPGAQGTAAFTLSGDVPTAFYSEPHGTLTATVVSNANAGMALIEITF